MESREALGFERMMARGVMKYRVKSGFCLGGLQVLIDDVEEFRHFKRLSQIIREA